MQVEPFLPVDAEQAGRLWLLTRELRLSLGDRAWAQRPLDLSMEVLR